MSKYDRRAADKRYRQKQAERIKAEREELAQLREEKKRWNAERAQWEKERAQWEKGKKMSYVTSGDSGDADQDSKVLTKLAIAARQKELQEKFAAKRKARDERYSTPHPPTEVAPPPKKPESTEHVGEKDPPRMSPPVSPPQRRFISIADLDTQEKVKRSLQMGELADMSEEFQKILFQSDPVLRQEWEDYQEIVLGRGSAVATHTPTEPNVTRLSK
jgi:hypothetical protein